VDRVGRIWEALVAGVAEGQFVPPRFPVLPGRPAPLAGVLGAVADLAGNCLQASLCPRRSRLAARGAVTIMPGSTSHAGVRVVAFPELIVPDVRKHLEWLPSSTSLVFSSSTDAPLAHSNFRRRVWLPALAVVGLEGVHLHDLRHAGNQLTANGGANLKELLARMGHNSERAALIYLHSSAERQRSLADAVGDGARAEIAKSKMPKKPNHLAHKWNETAARLLNPPMTCAPTATRTRDLPRRRSFRVQWPTAALVIRLGFLVALVPLDVRGFHLAGARGGHGASRCWVVRRTALLGRDGGLPD